MSRYGESHFPNYWGPGRNWLFRKLVTIHQSTRHKDATRHTTGLICIRSNMVKVKWSRYRPGVAQRVGRGIALLFHDRGTRRGWVVSSTPRPHFTPGKHRVPILQEARWVTGPVWTGRKISSPPGFDLGPSSPQSVAIPTELPGPLVLIWQPTFHTHTHKHIHTKTHTSRGKTETSEYFNLYILNRKKLQMILQSTVAHILQIQFGLNYSKKLLLLNIYTAKTYISFSLSRLHVSAANIHLHAVQDINQYFNQFHILYTCKITTATGWQTNCS